MLVGQGALVVDLFEARHLFGRPSRRRHPRRLGPVQAPSWWGTVGFSERANASARCRSVPASLARS